MTREMIAWGGSALLIVIALLLGALYVRGVAVERQLGVGNRHALWQAAAFLCGLLMAVATTAAPVVALAETSLTTRVAQIVGLTLIAAPLIWLGEPGMALWRGLPTVARMVVLRVALRRDWMLDGRPPERARTGAVMRTALCWLALVAGIPVLLLPPVMDVVLTHPLLAEAELFALVLIGLVYWAPVAAIVAQAGAGAVGYVAGSLYVVLAGTVLHCVGIVLMDSVGSFYAPYWTHARMAFGMTPVWDQITAGGALAWPADIVLFGMSLLLGWLWLRQVDRDTESLSEHLPSGVEWLDPDAPLPFRSDAVAAASRTPLTIAIVRPESVTEPTPDGLLLKE